MNWTGGRLQRSRHTGTSLYALQKTHFARVRTRLQNGPPTRPPLEFPVFIIAEDEGQALPVRGSLLASEASKHRTQRTLDKYHNTAPLAKPIKRRRSHDTAKAIEFHGQRRRSPLSSHIDHHIRHPQAVTTTKGSGSTSLYSKREAHRPERSLEAKRRELLQRQDWVGAAISKPLKMDFVEDKNHERIGKRRRLREDEHDGRRGMGFRTLVTAIDKRAKMDDKRPPPHHLPHDTISVRMGTSIPGSQRTRGNKDVTSQQRRHSDLSDPMLLDAEDITQRHYGSAGRKRENQTIRLLPIPLSCSSPGYIAATSENGKRSNSIGTVNAEAASQANATPGSDREGGLGAPFGRLVFSSSPCPKGSNTPSATSEVVSRVDNRAHGSGSIPQGDSGLERGTYDACWKKLLDISSSSVITHNTDNSPLSRATSQDLAALRNGTKAEAVQAFATPEDDNLINNKILPRLTTAHRESMCACNLGLTKKQIKFVSRSDVGDAKSISRFEESIWRDFVFGDEMDRDSSSIYERNSHQNDVSRSRSQPGASSIVYQASRENAKAAISTSSMSGHSPSSNSYLVPLHFLK
ncbi:MAG: hypothetical protein LQ347_000454 [Umbilicaria vellea]|nr:MAG: hypothetical protein LQ347_000454 [Umbilicaria vellea]